MSHRFLLLAALAPAVVFACGGQPAPSASAPPSSGAAEPPASASSAPAPLPASSTEHAPSAASSPAASADDAGAASPKAMTAKELVGDAGTKLVEGTVAGSQAVMGIGATRKLADVQPTLDATLKNVSHCYLAAQKKPNAPKNKRLNLKITIEPDGTVSSAADDGGSEVTDADLTKCVFAHYKKIKFAKAAGKAKDTATFHIVFGPDQPAP